MILEQLGLLAEASALTTASTAAAGYCLDLVAAKNDIGVSGQVWVCIKCTTTGSSGNSDGTYQFHLRMGSGSDGTDINAGGVDILSTDAVAEGSARATAGGWIARFAVPVDFNLQYLQIWKTFGGTSPTISVDITLSPTPPPSDYNRQTGPLATKAAFA